MKRCSLCNRGYSDDTLEFCLEDGTRLMSVRAVAAETPTVTLPNKSNLDTARTANSPYSKMPDTLETGNQETPTILSTNPIKEQAVGQGIQILEIVPAVVALAHNWWQWIYLNNQYYSSFSSYFLSANFLMWLLLLTAGAALSLLALKRCQNKAFAIISLVILSINLILFLVPKR